MATGVVQSQGSVGSVRIAQACTGSSPDSSQGSALPTVHSVCISASESSVGVPVSAFPANATETSHHQPAMTSQAMSSSQPSANGYSTPPNRDLLLANERHRLENGRFVENEASVFSPTSVRCKRKHDGSSSGLPLGHEAASSSKRKSSVEYLRKGQWTATEEKLARLLIEAFEEGYLPIYTGIRLRGYLAVQLQCDPMRVSKKLCAGMIDGKRIPKNYGQRKFKLRKKHLWDREEAHRIYSELEKLSSDLWSETGNARPSYLTLSSTKSAQEDKLVSQASEAQAGASSQLGNWVSDFHYLEQNISKLTEKGTAFPIIYLNLSKRARIDSRTKQCEAMTMQQDLPVGEIDAPCSTQQRLIIDVESFQAAQELIQLHYRTCQSVDESSR